METGRVALIRYALPDGTRYAASGLLIDEYHVLTADHVADGMPDTYRVEFSDAVAGVAEVLRTGTAQIDLAVLTLAAPAHGFARLDFACVGQGQVGEVGGCVAVGFPQWRKEANRRRSTQVNGTVPTADGFTPATGGGLAAGWLTLVGNRDPGTPAIPVGTLVGREAAPTGRTPDDTTLNRWGGMSGAGVTVGDLVIGVVRSDNVAAGGQSLTVTPVTLLSELPDEPLRDRFLAALGIHDLATLRVLPDAGTAVRVIELRGLGHQPDFAGRTAELARLLTLLKGPEAGPVVIHGLGGIGKSQLAAEYWHRHRAEFPVVWTLRAADPSVLVQDLAALGVLVGAVRDRGADVPAQANATRGWLAANSGWLLIIDGADDPAVIAAVQQLLPEGRSGRVIVTSQVSAWPARYQRLELTELATEDAVGLLPHGGTDASLQAARELADELGGLPLALRQAAGYCEQTGTTLARYLSLFRQTGRQARLLSAGADGTETVDVTWRVTIARVRERAPAAEELLNLLAYLAPAPIPRRMLAVAEDGLAAPPAFPVARDAGTEVLLSLLGEPLPADADLAMDQVLGVLRRYSLVQLDQDTITVHRLVQAAIRASHDREMRDLAVFSAVALIERALPRISRRTWPTYAALLPHALTAGDHGAHADFASQGRSVQLLKQVGNFQRDRGMYADAERVHEGALALARAMVPADPELTLAALSALVSTLLIARQPGKALPLAQQALLLADGDPETGDEWVIDALVGVGEALTQLGRTSDALPHFERAARLAETSFGPDHFWLLAPLTSIGETLREIGRPGDGLRFTRLALQLAEREYGPADLEAMIPATNIAAILTQLGRPAEALPYAQRAVRIAERELGEEHPQTLAPLNNLAAVLLDLAKFPAALPIAERALRIADRELGPDHPTTALPALNLAGILLNLGRPRDAVPFAERALGVIEREYGPEHLRAAIPLVTLANALLVKGEYFAPLELAERAVRIVDRELAPDDLRRASAIFVLGKALLRLGRSNEALGYLEQSIRIFDDMDPDWYATIDAAWTLADALEKENKPGEALPYAERTLRFIERELGPEHTAAFEPASKVALILSELDRHAEALAIAELALRAAGGEGQDAYRTALAASQAGGALVRLSRPAEAKPHLDRAVHIYTGMGHTAGIWFQFAAGHLAKACRDLGLVTDALEYAKRAVQYKEQPDEDGEPHATLEVTYHGGTVRHAACISRWAAEIAQDAGDTRCFVAMASMAASVCESAYGPASPEAIAAACMFASASLQAGEPAEAVDRLRDTLAAAEAEHGERSARLVPLLRYLAAVLNASGAPDEARPYLDRAEAAAGP